MKPLRLTVIAGLLIALGVPASAWAQRITCESHDYQRQYCPTGRITSAQIVSQWSNAACVQGRTWGWDANGIWVSQGCAGEFAYQGSRPPPPPAAGNTIECESRDYQQQLCGAGGRIARAWVIDQRSQAPCIEGRTWGYDSRGIWVNQGCSAVFGYEGGGRPEGNRIACESREYRQQFCGTGARVARAWVVEQRSDAPCVQGQTWGYQTNGIWVNQGCGAVFGFDAR